ncbi:chemotaxis protein [Parazoarcus communis]|uniref:Chemotaxis protein n=1 Tax=Parazoarcus communis TaxID=41977 RepID=A0A2U8H6J9_9RHOO|nr:PAS domain-containing methyl-accepting chemotaxis protein [Parazoarcus communis]AWI81190.1 chemotaxis protein [Parazoarcus communis]
MSTTNTRATGKESFLDPRRPIVTKTDLKGVITYANPAFVQISEYSRDELIGSNHNIVRHPDMPRAAFADLWRTIAAGAPWRGMVKNRTKSGGFYWVDAYITPVTDDGRHIGYMSVRSAPTQQARSEAEALYRAVSEGRQTLQPTAIGGGVSLGATSAVGLALILALAAAQAFVDGWVGFALLGVQAVLALALWMSIKAAVVTPLKNMLGLFRQIAEGNLKAEVADAGCREVRDLRSALRSMQVSLRALIGDVVASASDTSAEASVLHRGANKLHQGSSDQADQVSSSAAAMEQLAVSVGEIASATEDSAKQASQALKITQDGQRNMSLAAENTRLVVSAVEENQRMMAALGASVKKIGAVAEAISGIAKRTNLLALNAAIEAARAGEQGRGFAVVAGEVTELAGQTQRSTEDIARLVTEIAERESSVTESMAGLQSGVSRSVEAIQTLAGELEQISIANTAVSSNAEDVKHMLSQQQQASTDVAGIMERMSGITERNLGTVADVEAAAAGLEDTARELKLLVAHFEQRI